MFVLNLLGASAGALIAYFAIYYLGKIADGVQSKERSDLWTPLGFMGAVSCYFFFFGFNLQHGIFASLGLAILSTVGGTCLLVAISWLFSKAFDRLLDLGDKLKNWSKPTAQKQMENGQPT